MRTAEDETYTVKIHRAPDCLKRGRNRPLRDYESWYDPDGKLHRENGPASVMYDIETGIAINEGWFKHGTLHRADGPATVIRDGTTGQLRWTSWYVEGEQVKPPKRSAKTTAGKRPSATPA